MADISETAEVRTISAFFDDKAEADSAVQALLEEGVPGDSIRLVPGHQNGGDVEARPEEHRNFFEALADFFMPDEDRYSYAEGLSRGGFLVTVTNLDTPIFDRVLEILDREGAVNLDERESVWRSQGWSGYQTENLDDKTAGAPGAGNRTDEEVIPVVAEELQVGKRDVNLGRVRVRSYVRQELVSQPVNLREESVAVERRAVDQPLGRAEDAFVERTIEAEEHAEQPVVSKEARITEEVALRKESTERQENVSDTVRRTEVEVEDERNKSDTGSGRGSGTTDRK